MLNLVFVLIAALAPMTQSEQNGSHAAPERVQPMTANENRDELNQALRLAVVRRDIQESQRLIALGADPDRIDEIGHSALHNVAVFWGDPSAITLIADAGADPALRTPEGHTPLASAILWGHYRHDANGEDRLLSVVETLTAYGAKAQDTNSNGANLVREALSLGHARVAQRLLELDAEFPDDALLMVLKRTDAKTNAAILQLIKKHAVVLDLPLQDDAGRSAIHYAAASPETIETLRWLLDLDSSLLDIRDRSGMTPLAHAVFRANRQGMIELAAAGARLDTVANDGSTLLHLAAYEAHENVLEWLIERGASLSACNRSARRPLDITLITHRYVFSTPEEKERLVALLGGNAADIARGGFHNHPLHVAVKRMDIDEIERLLRSGTPPDVLNEYGETALRVAIDDYAGPYPMVPRDRRAFARKLLPLLIRHGADPGRLMPTTQRTYQEQARIMGVDDALSKLVARHHRDEPRTAALGQCPDIRL